MNKNKNIIYFIAGLAILFIILFKPKLGTQSLSDLDNNCESSEDFSIEEYHNIVKELAGLDKNDSCENSIYDQSNPKYCELEFDVDTIDLLYADNTSGNTEILFIKQYLDPREGRCSNVLINWLQSGNFHENFTIFKRNGRLIYHDPNQEFDADDLPYYTCNSYDNMVIMATEKMLDWYFDKYITCTDEQFFTGYIYTNESDGCVQATVQDTSNPFQFDTEEECMISWNQTKEQLGVFYSGYIYDETEKDCVLETKRAVTNPYKFQSHFNCMAHKRAEKLGLETMLNSLKIKPSTFFVLVIILVIMGLIYWSYEAGGDRGFIKKKSKKRKRKRK